MVWLIGKLSSMGLVSLRQYIEINLISYYFHNCLRPIILSSLGHSLCLYPDSPLTYALISVRHSLLKYVLQIIYINTPYR